MKFMSLMTIASLILLSSQSFAKLGPKQCVQGKITLTQNGPSLVSSKGQFIGTLMNPQDYRQGEEGFFNYAFDESPGIGDNQSFVTVQKVAACK